MNRNRRFLFGKQPGLALMELLMYMAIVAGLIAAAALSIQFAIGKYKNFKTKSALDSLVMGVDMYSMHNNGKAPSKQEGGLAALVYRPEGGAQWWEGPYITGYKKGQPKEEFEYPDAWGNQIKYNNPPQEFADLYKKYEIFSTGADENDKDGYIHRGK